MCAQLPRCGTCTDEARCALHRRGAGRQKLRPPAAGGPHPSRCFTFVKHRATFPIGEGLHGISAARDLDKKFGVNAMAGQGYNPPVTAFKSSIAVPASLTQGSRDSLYNPSLLTLHRGGEKCPPLARRRTLLQGGRHINHNFGRIIAGK